jgi:hypothetical protein
MLGVGYRQYWRAYEIPEGDNNRFHGSDAFNCREAAALQAEKSYCGS